MPITANWHLSELDLDEDPGQSLNNILSSAKVIDTSKSVAELQADLKYLLDDEGRYFTNANLHCPIKWQSRHRLMGGSDLSCYTCPYYRDSKMEAGSLICTIGRKQEDVIAQIKALQAAASLEEELAQAYAQRIEIGLELAEALL